MLSDVSSLPVAPTQRKALGACSKEKKGEMSKPWFLWCGFHAFIWYLKFREQGNKINDALWAFEITALPAGPHAFSVQEKFDPEAVGMSNSLPFGVWIRPGEVWVSCGPVGIQELDSVILNCCLTSGLPKFEQKLDRTLKPIIKVERSRGWELCTWRMQRDPGNGLQSFFSVVDPGKSGWGLSPLPSGDKVVAIQQCELVMSVPAMLSCHQGQAQDLDRGVPLGSWATLARKLPLKKAQCLSVFSAVWPSTSFLEAVLLCNARNAPKRSNCS